MYSNIWFVRRKNYGAYDAILSRRLTGHDVKHFWFCTKRTINYIDVPDSKILNYLCNKDYSTDKFMEVKSSFPYKLYNYLWTCLFTIILFCIVYVCKIPYMIVQISGGSTYKSFRRPPPPQDQILSFLHMFSPKSTCVGGWCPLQREILDPPLPDIKLKMFV